jgi:N-acetylglucosaminyldiphosphoundecaprenol N-acetyl-beta-D-mannosaminyltransferase
MSPDRANILGVGVSAIDMPLALDTIGGWIARRVPNYVCVTGVHGIIESYRSPELLEIHNRAGMVTPDGMPLVWLARMMGFPEVERVYGPDLMLGVCERSIARGWRHFLYGGAPGVPELLAEKLSERFPRIEIAGMYSPPFRPLSVSEDHDVVGRINDSGADIVWVGLSTPKQERWMAAHPSRGAQCSGAGRMRCRVRLPCRTEGTGAALDSTQRTRMDVPAPLGAAASRPALPGE